MNAFEQAISFQIGYVLFNPIGIEILNPIFKSKSNLKIKWEDLQTEDYVSNFTVMDKHQVVHINRSFSYYVGLAEDAIGYYVDTLLEEKNIKEEIKFLEEKYCSYMEQVDNLSEEEHKQKLWMLIKEMASSGIKSSLSTI